MEQLPLKGLPPPESQKKFVEHNNEAIGVLIDIPEQKLATAMLTLANCSQLLTMSPEPDALFSLDLRKTEAHLSFALLEMVSRTMSSYVPLKTLTSIYRVLPRISVSKSEAHLIRKLLNEVELMQTIPLE